MKIVYISPKYNGLYQYAKPFVQRLKEKYGEDVFHFGFKNICFDNDQIERNVTGIVKEIEIIHPDLIHYNYGTYDAEQLIPCFLERKLVKTKKILTVHSVQLDLFKKTKNREYDINSNMFAREMDGYSFFTNYSKDIFDIQAKPYCISFHPATLENIKLRKKDEIVILKKYSLNKNRLFVSLLGYASHWKSSVDFIKLAQENKNIQFVIGGPHWIEKIDKEIPDIDISKLNNLVIIDKELDAKELVTLIRYGIGFFPYFYYKSFQGSGMLPNYLYYGRNCIINNFEPLKEYVKYTSVVEFGNHENLRQSLEVCLKKHRIKRDFEFSYKNHFNKIEKLYKEVLET
jgi:hypothetical protein